MARIRRLISAGEKRVTVDRALTTELIPVDAIAQITQAMHTITVVVITVHCACHTLRWQQLCAPC